MPGRVLFVCLRFLLPLLPVACRAQQQPAASLSTCLVGRVSDGDSFRCGDGRRVRLIGIDSPEFGQRPYGEKARSALLQLLPPGSSVSLESDVAASDQYGRVLAYVWVGPRMVNEVMVRNGWAALYTVPPNVKYAPRLAAAQDKARAQGAGLWSQHGFECLPSDFRRRRCVNPP